ncbi:MAG: hypothetical protein GWP41_01725 [Planctomycetia bacterium]|nr:hypothetical protein [Planctomycetia bacterium]NCF99812.1 hypothetical protein [Planctomycetia bacterium]NCG12860.1 hypothetical protein [Planctomycetia bacterium]
MSSKGSTNDLVQIVLLTLFLCSGVFGAWGFYVKGQAAEYKARTAAEEVQLGKLKQLLGSAESKEVVLAHRRREDSKKNAGNISDVVIDIIESMKNSSARPEIKSATKDEKSLRDNFKKFVYNATFEPRLLRDHITFIANISARAPHLGFEKVKLVNRSKRGSYEDLWDLTLVIVSFGGEENSAVK